MKLIKLLCPLLIAMLLLSSCNTVQLGGGQSSLEGTPIESPSDTTPPEPTEPLTNEEMLELLRLMPDKQDLPSYDDLCKVKEGMRLEEVYSILGNPQTAINIRTLSTTGSASYESVAFVYNGTDESYLVVYYTLPQGQVYWVNLYPSESLTINEMIELKPDKQDLPSYDDLCKIKEGMRLEEVYSILGNPQAMPALSTGGIGYSYESDDGWSIIINYSVYNTVYSDIQGFCVMKVNIFEMVPPEASET